MQNNMRKGHQVHLHLSDEVWQKLDRLIAREKIKVSRTAYISHLIEKEAE